MQFPHIFYHFSSAALARKSCFDMIKRVYFAELRQKFVASSKNFFRDSHQAWELLLTVFTGEGNNCELRDFPEA